MTLFAKLFVYFVINVHFSEKFIRICNGFWLLNVIAGFSFFKHWLMDVVEESDVAHSEKLIG